ncbi:hypothetical protein COO60DRAFT_912432 [Scenedesmus sp. NREL 46B-D3]|nr:hypothetical protein COO60DRAFT_912432 [Scenedesmus sp. NREL 46B-D3]
MEAALGMPQSAGPSAEHVAAADSAGRAAAGSLYGSSAPGSLSLAQKQQEGANGAASAAAAAALGSGGAAGEEAAAGEPAKKRRRRRKGPAGDLNVALYIKQQQARGSTRKWRQQWVSVRTLIGGGEVKMLKWVSGEAAEVVRHWCGVAAEAGFWVVLGL